MQKQQVRARQAEIISQAGLQRRKAGAVEYSQQPLAPSFWVNPDIATAVGVAVNLLLLGDGVPYATVICQRGPGIDVDACIAKIPS